MHFIEGRKENAWRSGMWGPVQCSTNFWRIGAQNYFCQDALLVTEVAWKALSSCTDIVTFRSWQVILNNNGISTIMQAIYTGEMLEIFVCKMHAFPQLSEFFSDL